MISSSMLDFLGLGRERGPGDGWAERWTRREETRWASDGSVGADGDRGPRWNEEVFRREHLTEGEGLQPLRSNEEMFDEAMRIREIHDGLSSRFGHGGGDVDEGLAEPFPLPANGFGG